MATPLAARHFMRPELANTTPFPSVKEDDALHVMSGNIKSASHCDLICR